MYQSSIFQILFNLPHSGQSLNFCYPNEYPVISHCNFNLHSLAINDIKHLHLLFCFLYIFFGKISVHIFFPLNNWIIFPPIIHSILYLFSIQVLCQIPVLYTLLPVCNLLPFVLKLVF